MKTSTGVGTFDSEVQRGLWFSVLCVLKVPKVISVDSGEGITAILWLSKAYSAESFLDSYLILFYLNTSAFLKFPAKRCFF